MPSVPYFFSSIESNISLKASSVKPSSTPSLFKVSKINFFVSSLSRSPEPSSSYLSQISSTYFIISSSDGICDLPYPVSYLIRMTISSLPRTPEPSSSIASNILLKASSVKTSAGTPSSFKVSETNFFVSSLSRSPEPS